MCRQWTCGWMLWIKICQQHNIPIDGRRRRIKPSRSSCNSISQENARKPKSSFNWCFISVDFQTNKHTEWNDIYIIFFSNPKRTTATHANYDKNRSLHSTKRSQTQRKNKTKNKMRRWSNRRPNKGKGKFINVMYVHEFAIQDSGK